MIDSHCHINDPLYVNDPKTFILEAKNNGVNNFLVVGYDLKSSQNAIEIAEKFDCCFAAIGIHPSEVKNANCKDLEQIEELLQRKRVIAIGEIGLDYYWEKDEKIKELQRKSFISQIKLANKYNLPISIHCRDALNDCLNILKENPVKRGGVMHCYSGSLEMVEEFLKLGFLIGVGGVVTFKNAEKIKTVVKKIPLDSFVLETDCPYLTPVPYRGKPNHSKYLCFIRDEIAKLRNISSEEVELNTTNNFNSVFYEKDN